MAMYVWIIHAIVNRPTPISADSNVDDQHMKGGGLALIFKGSIKSKILSLEFHASTFESLCVMLSLNGSRIIFAVIYRSGSKKVTTTFFEELDRIFGCLQRHCCTRRQQRSLWQHLWCFNNKQLSSMQASSILVSCKLFKNQLTMLDMVLVRIDQSMHV